MRNVTINEIKDLYDVRVINRSFYMVEDAIRIIEDMDLDIDTIIKVLNINVKFKKEVVSNEQHDFYKVCSTKDSVDIIKYTKDNTYIMLRFDMDKDDEDEIFLTEEQIESVAKGIILSLFIRALEKDGAEPINELQLEDALNKNNMIDFDKRVEALASRILIPKKEFDDKLWENVYYTSYNEQRGEEQLLSVDLIRKFLIEKLMKKYNVTEHMANVRLSIANVEDKKNDPLGQSIFSSFKRSYFDDENVKDSSKTKK